jgi:drug/metabolite transporter (DMT)-like permease
MAFKVVMLRGDTSLSSSKNATLFGSGALLLWVAEPLLVSEMTGMPIFEALSIIFFSCFIPNAIRLTLTNKWHVVRNQPIFVWLIGIACICGSDLSYILGASCAPIAHVDLIDYMWPCMVVLFIGMLPKETLKVHHIIGITLGVLGIFVLITDGNGLSGIKTKYLLGYSLAFYGAMLWGIYSAFSRYYKNVPSDMVSMYCGVGAVICVALHMSFETTIMPSGSQLAIAMLIGLTGPGLAYQLWDYGIKHGNFKLLISMTYLVRILAMILLVSFDKGPVTDALIIACALASFGMFITSLDVDKIKSMKKLFKKKSLSKLLSKII